MKNLTRTICLLLLLSAIFTGCQGAPDAVVEDDIFAGKIIEITRDEKVNLDTSGGAYEQRIQEADVKLTQGPYEGQIVKVINTMDQVLAYDIELYENRQIYVMMQYAEDGSIDHGLVYRYKRDTSIYVLIGIFVALMVVIGGWEGIRTLITLCLTMGGVFYMLVGISRGGDPVILSVFVSIVVVIVTMFVVAGFSSKALSAIMGTLGGVFISGIIAIIFSHYAVLTGLGTQEAQFLMFSQGDITFDFGKILFASILLGTLGAVMDVCISIASAINEITAANPFMLKTDLFRAGMNIGRDIMGTMANTLILAYAGSSIFLILVFMMNDIPYFDIINMDIIATEIVRAIGGTIGLILSIPLTAYVSAVLEKRGIGGY